MRVLCDTNIFISYLLKTDKKAVISTIIDAAMNGDYELLLPEYLINELRDTIAESSYLNEHISMKNVEAFIETLYLVGEIIPAIDTPIPRVVRDKNDDYLIANAILGQADYLVSGDKDLLVLQKAGSITIISPAQFRRVIKKTEDRS